MSRLSFFVLVLFAATLRAAEPIDSVEFTGVLQAGDSGAKIAARAGVTLADLAALNRDVNFSRLTIGQHLRVR